MLRPRAVDRSGTVFIGNSQKAIALRWLSESRVEWGAGRFRGCIFAGAVGVPIYPTLRRRRSHTFLTIAAARALFVSTPAKLAEIEIACANAGNVENVVLFDADASGYACFQRASPRAVPYTAGQGSCRTQRPPHEKNHLSLAQLEMWRAGIGRLNDPDCGMNLARAAKPGDLRDDHLHVGHLRASRRG